MNRIYQFLVRIGTAGIDDEGEINRIIISNKISHAITISILCIGSMMIYFSDEYYLAYPLSIDFLGNISVPFLNSKRKHYLAKLALYYTQCLALAYFGFTLASLLQLEYAVVLLIWINNLIFNTKSTRAIGLIAAIIVFILMSYAHYNTPFDPVLGLSYNQAFIIHRLVVFAIIIIAVLISSHSIKRSDLSYILERSNKFIKLYVAQISHEIRMPLNAVFGFAQMMKKEIKMDPSLKKMESSNDQMLAATNNARSIINNVLDMAQIESGKLDALNLKGFFVDAFFQNIVAINSVNAEDKKIELHLTIEDMPDVIIADKLQLNQIVTNLLTNAIKYSYKETKIFIRARACAGNLNEWQLQIINHGPGIPQETMPNIFKPFITEKKSSQTESSGLGLYIVFNKVNLMGGTISVESELSGYTVFTVTLPLIRGWLKDVKHDEENDFELYEMKGIRVLLAEDEPLNAKMLLLFLEKNGCEVTHVKDGYDVLEKVQLNGEKFDMIIMDYHMPKLSGDETLKRLKHSETTKSIPIIIATGDAFIDAQDHLIRLGADAVVEKPIEFKVLLHIMQKHLPNQ